MSSWTCDCCGQPIVNVGDGWVEWKRYIDENKNPDGLRLVHHRKVNRSCAYDEDELYVKEQAILNDLHLHSFLGDDGLMRLLIMLSEEKLPQDEVIEMIKRLHIKGYEESRLHFDEAIYEGVFEPNTPPSFYWQSDIEATIKYIKEKS